jgi:hypothetical protein
MSERYDEGEPLDPSIFDAQTSLACRQTPVPGPRRSPCGPPSTRPGDHDVRPTKRAAETLDAQRCPSVATGTIPGIGDDAITGKATNAVQSPSWRMRTDRSPS